MATGSTSVLLALLILIRKELLNSEPTSFDLKVLNLELSVFQVFSELITREACDCLLHLLVESFTQGLADGLVVRVALVLKVLVLVLLCPQLEAVQFFSDVGGHLLEVLQGFCVVVNEDDAGQRPLQGEVLSISNEAAILNRALHSRESLLHSLIQQCLIVVRDLQEVDRLLIKVLVLWIDTVSEVLVELLRQEWCDARHQDGRAEQDIEEDVEAPLLLLDAFVTFHTWPVQSDVPVRQLLEELKEWWHNVVELVAVHLTSDVLDEVLIGRHDPAVHEVVISSKVDLHLGVEDEVKTCRLLIPGDVLDQESVGIEPWQEDLLDHRLYSWLPELKLLGSHDWGVAEIETASVPTVVVCNLHGIWVVLQALRHFLAVGCEDCAVDDQVLEWCLSLHGGRDDHQGVEPTTSLVDTLSDEVGWESFHELLVTDREWVVALGEWHGATLEPTIEYLRDSSQNTLALLRGDCKVVNVFSVKIGDVSTSSQLLKLLDGANTDYLLIIIGDPQRDWVTPIPVPGEAPVSSVFEPVLEPLVLYPVWNPPWILVVLDESLFDVGDPDEPGADSSVDERCIRPPAEWITMLDGAGGDQSLSVLQVFYDKWISILDVFALEIGDDVLEVTVIIDRHDNLSCSDETVLEASLVILLSEAWRTMNNTCTSVSRDELALNNTEAIPGCLSPTLEVRIKWRVFLSHELATLQLGDDLMLCDLVLLEYFLETYLGNNEYSISTLVLDLDVVEVWVHCASQVRWKGPWCGCPCHEACIWLIDEWERDED